MNVCVETLDLGGKWSLAGLNVELLYYDWNHISVFTWPLKYFSDKLEIFPSSINTNVG